MLVLKNTDFINIYVNFPEIHVDIAKNLLKICINHEGSDEILLILFLSTGTPNGIQNSIND